MTRSAAIVTVGSELTEGLRIDTNTAEVARALQVRGFSVVEAISVSDDAERLAATFRRLLDTCDLVIATGGLGPTHDDVTRVSAAAALGVDLVRDETIAAFLEPWRARHADAAAADQIMVQALVLPGAEILHPTTGTAPGLIARDGAATLVLLPGPPSEMRPMLGQALGRYDRVRAEPVQIGVTGLSESDAQITAQRALEPHAGVTLTVLAKPGDVQVILFDSGAGPESLEAAGGAVRAALGDHVYATGGESLAEAVVRALQRRSLIVACAESCTGGMVSAALTDVSGASAVFAGGAVTYADAAKVRALGVEAATLSRYGAVSKETAIEMAVGARALYGADLAISVTGIAGPDGGTKAKPVGLVWFAIADASGTHAKERRFPQTGREAIRGRSTTFALDLLRRSALGIGLPG